jgi:nucleotide-binding universal stress UspA family protein
MKLLQKILLAHDFSKSSEQVVATAITLAKVFQAKIIPIHVLPDEDINEKVKLLLHETATQKLEQTADRIKKEGIEVGEPLLKYGSPYESIVNAAQNERVNLIVVGSGETIGKENFQLGTTAHRIIQGSDQPVFVVKEGDFKVERILCPVDFSSNSKRALKNAITISRRFEAELVIMNVLELPGVKWLTSQKGSAEEQDQRLKQQKEKFNQFVEDFNLVGLNCRQEIRNGEASSEILKAVSEHHIDLLLMGTAGKTGLSRLVIGSVTEKVIREVPCSFVVLKSADVIQLQLESSLKDLENHYQIANQLMADGFFEESIEEFEKCIYINSMHVPSYYGIAKVYDKLENSKNAEIFRDRAKEIMDRMWDMKIEEEIRRHYNP